MLNSKLSKAIYSAVVFFFSFALQAESMEYLSLLTSPAKMTRYEEVLITRLRDRSTQTEEVRKLTQKLAEILVAKVVQGLPIKEVSVESPVATATGHLIDTQIELVSIMRSGDALLETFFRHFSEAGLSKILIQRDEATAEPQFKYMKLTPTVASGAHVIILEPMIATGGTLGMSIDLLKQRGVQENKIMIASLFAAPEGLSYLQQRFPEIKVAVIVVDERLNEKKYIVPGVGDFGDRYFGTE